MLYHAITKQYISLFVGSSGGRSNPLREDTCICYWRGIKLLLREAILTHFAVKYDNFFDSSALVCFKVLSFAFREMS
jgi:hypothetical protein